MASATPLSKDTEQNVATSDPNPGPSGDWTVRRNVDRWKRGGNSESGAGDQMGTSAAPQSDIEKEDRMRMVIHQLYGSQSHYQAAQKFLKNRTLRKMNDNGGMTLYERIMAYRRLKGEEEADEGQTGTNSPKQQTESQRTSPAKGRVSRHSPAQRPTSGRGSVRPLDRSDTSFASVDISDITQLDEEKNRSPSPQPTFENRPNTRKRGQGGHDYEALTTARDVQLHVDDSEERVTDRRAFSAEERSAVVTTAAVAMAAHAHTSNSHEDKRQERTDRQKVEREEVHEEKSEKVRKEKSEVHEEKSEKVRKEKTDEVHEEKSEKVRKEKSEEVHEEKSEEHKEKSQKRNKHKTKSEEREENIEETVMVAAVAGVAVSESSREDRSEKEKVKRKEKHKSKKKHSESVNEKETSDEKREDKTKSSRNSSRSSEKETSFIEQVSDKLEASETGSGTPEPSKTPEAPAIEAAASPVASAAPAAAAAAAAAPKPKKSKSRAKSARKKGKEEEDTSTIAALDKLADKNLNSLLGNDDGAEDSEVDQEALDKVFNPKFQAELDNFLRTT